jgi:hypothetical protein
MFNFRLNICTFFLAKFIQLLYIFLSYFLYPNIFILLNGEEKLDHDPLNALSRDLCAETEERYKNYLHFIANIGRNSKQYFPNSAVSISLSADVPLYYPLSYAFSVVSLGMVISCH